MTLGVALIAFLAAALISLVGTELVRDDVVAMTTPQGPR